MDARQKTNSPLGAARIICAYENQPLSTSSTHAVPRLLAQLVERLACDHSPTEFVAVSPGGGAIAGVRNISAELGWWGRTRCRAANNRWARKIRQPKMNESVSYQRVRTVLEDLHNDELDQSTVVIVATMSAALLAKQMLPRAKVVYWVQGMPRLGQESIAASAINAVDAVIAPSQAIYNDLFQLIGRDRFAPPVWVVPNAIDRTQFKHESADTIVAIRQRLGLGDDQVAVMHIGRAPEKGLQIIAAALTVGTFRKKMVLVSAGGPTKQRRQLTANTEILEVGRVTPSELNQIYQACHFGVVPSVWWENCPLALIEMMSLGVCPIGSRVGGIPEMIEHGKSGLIIDSPNDAHAWAMAMERLAADDPLRLQMGTQAKQSSLAKFDQDQSLLRWRQVLDTVIAAA